MTQVNGVMRHRGRERERGKLVDGQTGSVTVAPPATKLKEQQQNANAKTATMQKMLVSRICECDALRGNVVEVRGERGDRSMYST